MKLVSTILKSQKHGIINKGLSLWISPEKVYLHNVGHNSETGTKQLQRDANWVNRSLKIERIK